MTHGIKGSRLMGGLAVLVVVLALVAASAWAQAVGGAEKARPVAGDPGISTMLVMDQPQFRVLRDYAEPGATRRMHSHDDATWHVFTLVTGQLLLTIEGEPPVEVAQGQVLNLKGGAKPPFTNPGPVAATIVEMLGKAPRPAAAASPAYGGDLTITPLVPSSVQLEAGGLVVQVDPWSRADLARAKPA